MAQLESRNQKKGSPLIAIAVALVVILGPMALSVLIPAVIIFVIVRLAKGSKHLELNGTHPANGQDSAFDPGRFDYDQSRYEQKTYDFDKSEEEDNRFGLDLEDAEHSTPFEDLASHFKSRSQPHEFGSHVHVVNDDHSRESRLRQLEVLKNAGLYTDKEYRQAKERIIRETRP